MRKKKALYSIVTNLILQLVVIIYGFIVPKIIISHFGSDVNGLISSITQFLAYITLLESGFGPVVKSALYKPIANKNKSEIANILKTAERFFRKIAIIFIAYIIILCFIYPIIISNKFDTVFTVSLIIIISISTFAEYFFGMTYRLYLQADQKNYIISLIQIFTYILSAIAIVILAMFNFSIEIIKLVSGLIFVLRPILQNAYVKKKYDINLNNANNNYLLKQKWDGLAQHIASVIHTNTDVTVLTIFSSLSEVSVYSVYYLVVRGIKQIAQSFSTGIDSSFGDMIAKNEHHNLNEKFELYEILYFTVITILFSSTIILITPFITVYTNGIKDANYIRYLFGILITISEYIWAIRLPYSSLTLAAGHFKQTQVGAWVECVLNIILSVILVQRYGIIGVAIGTIIAMLVRTIEFVYHANKYILKRNMLKSLKEILVLLLETILVVLVFNIIPLLSKISYLIWIINAVIVLFIVILITCLLNTIFYRKMMKKIMNLFFRKKGKNEKLKF